MDNSPRPRVRIRSQLFERWRVLIFIAAFIVLGLIALLAARAATQVFVLEAEDGTLSPANATTLVDPTASAGKSVQFGNTPTPPTPAPPTPVPPVSTAWKPLKPGTHWQWQLTGTVNETVLDNVTGAKMYDIDMENATAALVARLQAKGIYVVCYVESGDWARSRPDAGDYAPAILGKSIDGFPDEKFVNVNAIDSPAGPTGKTLRQIMMARLDRAKAKGCDGIEPDLDDLHTYSTGFTISQAAQVAFNKMMIDAAHARGMSMGLKNGADPDGTFDQQMLAAGADWVINEECNQYDECGGYSQFAAAGRAVFQVEYLDNQGKPYGGTNGTCAKNNAANFDGIVKDSSSSLSALPLTHCR